MEILVLLFPFLLLYVLLIRPQQRRLREAQLMAASLQPEDEVVTAGGIHGTVTAVDEDTVWLEIAPGVIVRVLKGAIAQRLSEPVVVVDEDEDGDGDGGDTTPGDQQGRA
jgi:preprotein translocase subunit YajC